MGKFSKLPTICIMSAEGGVTFALTLLTYHFHHVCSGWGEVCPDLVDLPFSSCLQWVGYVTFALTWLTYHFHHVCSGWGDVCPDLVVRI